MRFIPAHKFARDGFKNNCKTNSVAAAALCVQRASQARLRSSGFLATRPSAGAVGDERLLAGNTLRRYRRILARRARNARQNEQGKHGANMIRCDVSTLVEVHASCAPVAPAMRQNSYLRYRLI